MSITTETTPTRRWFMGQLRTVNGQDADDGIPALSHYLPIEVPGSDSPVMYTVYLAANDRGMFLVTCRQLPDILTFGTDDDEAMAHAVMAIEDKLAGQR